MAAFVQSCSFWSSWLPSVFGLVGTGLLAWSTWRAVQLAKERNGVMSRLLDLEADIAKPSESGAEGDADTEKRLAALDEAQMALLNALKNDLDAADQRWTPSDTRRTYAGVLLTILSYAIPAVAYLPRLCGKG
jgi:hypothetical protein